MYGLDAQRLTHGGGCSRPPSPSPTTTSWTCCADRALEAVEAAVVVGDPCIDRLVASLPRRPDYRRSLGVDEQHELAVVSSTGPGTASSGTGPICCHS